KGREKQMIAYAMLGTNDKDKAVEFYDKLFEGTDIKKLFKTQLGGQYYGRKPGEPMICITNPYDGNEACSANGIIVALDCEETVQIDELYVRGLGIVAMDEGAPVWRAADIFYGAYFYDLDGNKLSACKIKLGE